MGKSQREKGANAEREVAQLIRKHGFNARRGQVFNHEPDIITDIPVHLEIKRQETTKIHEWMKQSTEQSRGQSPAVVHRRNREDWLITMKFEDWLEIIAPPYTGDFEHIDVPIEDDLPFLDKEDF